MKHLLIVLVFAVSPAAAYAQADVVRVQIDSGETYPSGWSTVDQAWTRPARIFYVLPASLVAAH